MATPPKPGSTPIASVASTPRLAWQSRRVRSLVSRVEPLPGTRDSGAGLVDMEQVAGQKLALEVGDEPVEPSGGLGGKPRQPAGRDRGPEDVGQLRRAGDRQVLADKQVGPE